MGFKSASGRVGREITKFYLAMIMVTAAIDALYVSAVFAAGRDLKRFYIGSDWTALKIGGSIAISLLGLAALRRSKGWMRELWAYVTLLGSGYGVVFVLLFSYAGPDHYPWGRAICEAFPSLRNAIVEIEASLGILAVGFCILVDYWMIRYLLPASNTTFAARLRMAANDFLLPAGIGLLCLMTLSTFIWWLTHLGHPHIRLGSSLLLYARIVIPIVLPALIAATVPSRRMDLGIAQ